MPTKKAKATKARMVPDELQAVVLEALRDAPSIRGAQFKKALPKPYQEFNVEARALACHLAQHGEIHRRVKGSAEIFFARDPLAMLDEIVPNRLPATPIDEATLKALVAEAAPDLKDLLKEWLPSAIARRLVFQHAPPPRSTKKRYGKEPDIAGSLAPVIVALRKALSSTDPQGISRQRVAEALLAELALPQSMGTTTASPIAATSQAHASNGRAALAAREQFILALNKLMAENPGQALLSVRDLRARLAISKELFDTVALDLSREGAVSLHQHDHPASLSELEQSQLIRDARGAHYIGIAPRRG